MCRDNDVQWKKKKMVPFTPTRTYTRIYSHTHMQTTDRQHAERIRSSARAYIPLLTRDTRKL